MARLWEREWASLVSGEAPELSVAFSLKMGHRGNKPEKGRLHCAKWGKF
jgi:hypothetical protein